jgi:hypothetical protein
MIDQRVTFYPFEEKKHAKFWAATRVVFDVGWFG